MRAIASMSVALVAAAAFAAPAEANLTRNCVYGSAHTGDRHTGVVYGAVVVYDPLATGTTYTCTFKTASGTVLWTASFGTPGNAAVLVAAADFTTTETAYVCTTYSWNDASGSHSDSLGCQVVLP